jgi:hypothetical protein
METLYKIMIEISSIILYPCKTTLESLVYDMQCPKIKALYKSYCAYVCILPSRQELIVPKNARIGHPNNKRPYLLAPFTQVQVQIH